MSSETSEDVRPGIEQGLVYLAWVTVTVVVAVDMRGTIALTFWRHGGVPLG